MANVKINGEFNIDTAKARVDIIALKQKLNDLEKAIRKAAKEDENLLEFHQKIMDATNELNEAQNKYNKLLNKTTEEFNNINKEIDKQKKKYDELINKVKNPINPLNPFNKRNENLNKRLSANELARLQETKPAKLKELSKEYTSLREEELSNAKMDVGIGYAISAVKKFGQEAGKIFKMMGLDLKSIMRNMIDNISSYMATTSGVASYDTTSSIFTNASARNQAMKYGLSSSSNWALTKTANTLFGGTSNLDEDIAYMNSTQKQKFSELMDKYSSWYDEMQSSGLLQNIQEFQLEFSMFKEEMSIKLLQWFGENKDTIMFVLDASLNVLKFIGNAITGLANFFGANIGASDSVLNGSKSITVNIENTNNNNLSNGGSLAMANNIADSTIKSISQSIKSIM